VCHVLAQQPQTAFSLKALKRERERERERRYTNITVLAKQYTDVCRPMNAKCLLININNQV